MVLALENFGRDREANALEACENGWEWFQK